MGKINKYDEELKRFESRRLTPTKKEDKRFVKEKNNKSNLPYNVSHFISSKKNIDLEQNQAVRKYENKYYVVLDEYDKIINKNIIKGANIKTGQAPISVTKLFNATIMKVAQNDYQQKEYIIDIEEYGRLTGQITDSDSQEKISQTKTNIKRQVNKDMDLLLSLRITKTLDCSSEADSVPDKKVTNVFGSMETKGDLIKYTIQESILNKMKTGNDFNIKDSKVLLSAKTTATLLTELFLENKLSGKLGENGKVEVKMLELYNYIKDSRKSYEDYKKQKESRRWKEQIRDTISNILLDIQEGKRFSFDFEPISELIDCETWEEFINEKIIVSEWQEE